MEVNLPQDSGNRLTEVKHIVENGWKALLRQRTLAVTLAAIAAFLSVFLVLWALETAFYMSSTVKWIFVIVGFAFASATAWFVARQLDKPGFRSYYAALSVSAGNESLRNALDLHLQRSRSSMFHDRALQQNLENCTEESILSQKNAYEQAHPTHQSYRRSAYASGVLFLMLIAALVFQSSGLMRSVQFWKTFQPPIPFTYVISPGNQILEQGNGFQARIQFEGDLVPRQVAIGLKTDVESEYRLQQMTKIDDLTFISEPFSFTNTTQYYIQMDRYRSESYLVEIQLLPRFEELNVVITPPRYTGLEASSQAYPFTVIEAYPGTTIDISALANKALERVTMSRSSSDEIVILSQNPEDEHYIHSLVTAQSDTLSFRLSDEVGFENRNPFQFVIVPLVDQFPSILLLEPESDINLLNPETVQLGYEFRDDFGFNRLRLRYQIKKAFGQPVDGTLSLPAPRERNGVAISPFDLTAIGAQPLDEVIFWLELFDNDAVAGFKMAESQKRTIKLASMAEYLDLVEEKEENVEQELKQMDERYREFEKLMENFQEDLKTNQLDEFNKNQMLEELQEKQESVNESARKLKEEFEQLKNEFKQNDVLSPETVQQYEQLQKLIEEIDSPELREALRQMQESLQNMDPNMLREAMQNLEFNEELYKQRLERTLELFRQLKTNAELDKLSKNYEDLARRQREVANEKTPTQQQREQQEAIKEELEKTQEKLDELDKDAPKNAEEELKKLQEEMKPEIEKTKEQLDDIIEEMKKNEGGEGEKSEQQEQQEQSQQQEQQDAAEQMEKMASRVKSSMSAMSQQQQTVNINALKSVLRTLLLLSETQEDITTKTAQQPFRSNGFVDLARRENAVNQTFGITVDTLISIASRVPQLSNVILEKKTQVQKNLDNSMLHLAERDNGNASAETRFVLSGINELGTMIANLLDQMESQSSGSGGSGSGSMMQQLQEMSGQQQQLNQMMQDMINDIQGERLSQDQMERFNQMARQQNDIRRQLEEMRQNGNLPEGDRIMSELERLAQEMEDAINDIRGGRTDRQFINRQQNILSRMLQAEQALQEREEDEKRKGTTGDQQLRALPPELTLEELRKRIRSRLSDPNMSKFSEDYQKLIEKYFEVLERRNN